MAAGLNTATTRKTNQTISGVGNLVATSTGAGGAHCDRPISGLTYFSAVITTLTGTPQIGLCLVDSLQNVALDAALSSIGYLSTGAVRINSSTIATIATFAAGNRIDCAVHWGFRLIWFRVNGGNWNNNAANDPATFVGGIDLSTMTAGAVMCPAIYASASGTVWTMEFSTPFTNAAPAGYSSIDVIQFNKAILTGELYPLAYVPTGTPVIGPVRASQMPTDELARLPFNGGTITRVSGTVMELGVTVPNRRVDVYDRDTGELLGTDFSASDGTWEVIARGRVAVRVVGSDPTTYNSLVYDNVVPN